MLPNEAVNCESTSKPTSESTSESTKARLLNRLSSYWKMELANVLFLPAVALVTVSALGGKITGALLLSLFTTAWLLVIGTIALLMLLKELERDKKFSEFWLPKLRLAKLPSLVLVVVCIVVTVVDVISVAPAFTAAQYGAMLFSLLALLEYINYYHCQLQHFDNQADFQRLISGRGFRQSHLARALERYERLNQSHLPKRG